MIRVTGGTGHGRRAVVCRRASHGHDVVAMVRDVHAAGRRLPSTLTVRSTSLCNTTPRGPQGVQLATHDSGRALHHDHPGLLDRAPGSMVLQDPTTAKGPTPRYGHRKAIGFLGKQPMDKSSVWADIGGRQQDVKD